MQERLHREILENVHEKAEGRTLYEQVMCLPYLSAVVSETLRLYPPVVIVNREASTDYHLTEHNLTIEKGVSIIIPVLALHRMAEYYPQPTEFRPERFMDTLTSSSLPPPPPAYAYLPFGAGPRNCIGMRFALAEIKLALALLVRRFRFEPNRAGDSEKATPARLKPISSFVLFKTNPIHVRIEKRV